MSFLSSKGGDQNFASEDELDNEETKEDGNDSNERKGTCLEADRASQQPMDLPSCSSEGQNLLAPQESTTLQLGPQFSPTRVHVKRQSSRSPSPERKAPRHLPGSRALQAGIAYRKMVRYHPSLQEFRSTAATEITISRSSYLSLLDTVESGGIALATKMDATAWEILQNPVAGQGILVGKSKGNSDYDNTEISMQDLQPWDDFPTFREIYEFSLAIPELRVLFHEILHENAAMKSWYEHLYDDPGYLPPTEENSVARNSHFFFSQLNALLRLACVGPQNEAAPEYKGLSPTSMWLCIGGGKCATKRRKLGNPAHRNPDLVAYWTDGNNDRLNANPKQPGLPGDTVPCQLVGDIKMANKFTYSHLKEGIDGNGKAKFSAEGNKVMNQIHDYVDMHHNRFGYVITQQDLIMLRRRDEPPGKWGQIDYSHSIPVSSEKGTLNAMIVLWYFHVKYVIMGLDGGCMLQSCYENCPEHLRGKSKLLKTHAVAGKT
jgi:hypothetical protein